MQAMRQAQGIYPQVWYLQDLLPHAGFERGITGSAEIKLVIFKLAELFINGY
jgi:hypothetical protein